jgi:hypothetical protein
MGRICKKIAMEQSHWTTGQLLCKKFVMQKGLDDGQLCTTSYINYLYFAGRLYSLSTQKADVHLKLGLKKDPEVGVRRPNELLGQATNLQDLEGMVDSIDAIC